MIIGILLGVLITLVVGILIVAILPKRKGDPDSYGRQQWHIDEEDDIN